MISISKADWGCVHDFACEIANASAQGDSVLSDSKTEALLSFLNEMQAKYGSCSRITATMADYTEENSEILYRKALYQARAEGDTENELMILASLKELEE